MIENGWAPVRAALVRQDSEVPEGEENLAFADLVHALRQFAIVANGDFGRAEAKMAQKTVRNEIERRLQPLREGIAEHLKAAMDAGSIRLRLTIDGFVANAFAADDFAIITTNWDLLLEGYFPGKKIVHVHGDIVEPRTLYLPSEFSRELYRRWDSHPSGAWGHRGRATNANWYMTSARTVAICGLSLSPLDPELSDLFKCLPGEVERVLILDVDPDTVARRVRYHLRRRPSRNAKIELFRPEDFSVRAGAAGPARV